MNSVIHDISKEVSHTLQALEKLYYENLENQRNRNS